jgi:hypothetical protein
MSANPRRVTADVTLYWPPGNSAFPLYIRKGTVVDVPPGSQLETAYGAGSLQVITTGLGSPDTLSKSALAN